VPARRAEWVRARAALLVRHDEAPLKSDVTLCAHLASRDLAALPIGSRDILEWYDGPVTAVARCPECSQLGLLELLDWSRGHRIRIYALAGLESESLAVYQRNAARGSCDPGRFEQETAALLACAGPVQRLIVLDLDGNAVLWSAPPPADFRFPETPWRERLRSEADGSWFARLGIEELAEADR
jgi:hypothetical protein